VQNKGGKKTARGRQSGAAKQRVRHKGKRKKNVNPYRNKGGGSADIPWLERDQNLTQGTGKKKEKRQGLTLRKKKREKKRRSGVRSKTVLEKRGVEAIGRKKEYGHEHFV